MTVAFALSGGGNLGPMQELGDINKILLSTMDVTAAHSLRRPP